MLETTVAHELIEGLLGGNSRTRMEEIDYHSLAVSTTTGAMQEKFLGEPQRSVVGLVTEAA